MLILHPVLGRMGGFPHTTKKHSHASWVSDNWNEL